MRSKLVDYSPPGLCPGGFSCAHSPLNPSRTLTSDLSVRSELRRLAWFRYGPDKFTEAQT